MNVNIRYAPSFNTEVSTGKAANRAVDRRQATNTWKKKKREFRACWSYWPAILFTATKRSKSFWVQSGICRQVWACYHMCIKLSLQNQVVGHWSDNVCNVKTEAGLESLARRPLLPLWCVKNYARALLWLMNCINNVLSLRNDGLLLIALKWIITNFICIH